jgi:hypothetical protein
MPNIPDTALATQVPELEYSRWQGDFSGVLADGRSYFVGSKTRGVIIQRLDTLQKSLRFIRGEETAE